MRTLAFVPALVLLVLAGVYPIGVLFFTGSFRESPESLDWIRLLGLTYGQAGVSALLSLCVGVPGALLWCENEFRGRRLMEALAFFCFSLPPLLVVLAVTSVFGRMGILGGVFERTFGFFLYGWSGVLLAHVFLNFPLSFLFVGNALQEMPREAEMAALSLGASRTEVFLRITLRKLLPSIGSAFALSFLYCASSFVIVLLLGGGPSFTTLEVALYIATKVELNLAMAARLGGVQALGALVLFTFLSVVPSAPKASAQESRGVLIFRIRSRLRARIAMTFYLGLVVVFFIGPIVGLLASGMKANTAWREILASVGVSLLLSLAVACVSVTLALGLSYSERHARSAVFARAIGGLASLPIAFSSILLTTAWFIAYPVRFSGFVAFFAVIGVQSFLALPLVYRAVRDRHAELSNETLRTARSLGASTVQSLFWIELPFLRRAVFTGLLLGSVFSLGEVGALLMLSPDGTPPLSLLIFRWMHQYRFDAAYSAGAVLLVLVGLYQLARRAVERIA